MVRFFVLMLMLLTFVFSREVPFTQEDRDRLRNVEIKVERLEVKVEEGQKALQRQIDGLQKQIDNLRTLMLWGFGVLFSGMGILIGLVMWDRRTAISPVVKKTKELEDKSDKVEKVLKELAKEDPKIEQALKKAGLL